MSNGGEKVPKKCHILFERPLSPKSDILNFGKCFNGRVHQTKYLLRSFFFRHKIEFWKKCSYEHFELNDNASQLNKLINLRQSELIHNVHRII